MDPAAWPPKLPVRIGRYKVERLLGGGGHGAVVLARAEAGDAAAGRGGAPVAIKLIDLGGADGEARALLFAREVEVARRLDHPRIVRVHDAGREGDFAWIAMEYVAGGDLGQRQRGKPPLTMREAAQVAADVAEALAHAHAQGALHRDVKPANILLEPSSQSQGGRAKLADFGLARLADFQRSRTGVLAGTPAYMAPEQLSESGEDGRTDLYSLGAVLFELLAGRLPHEAPSLGALLRAVSQHSAPPLERLRPDAPPALAALVARLLARDRSQRPDDAAGAARELAALLSDWPAGAA